MIWDKIWVEDKNFLVIVEPAETCDSLTDAVEVLKTAFISIHLPNQGSISLTVLCLISILCAWHWNFTPQKSFLKVRRIVQKLGKGCKPVYEIDPRAYFYQKNLSSDKFSYKNLKILNPSILSENLRNF